MRNNNADASLSKVCVGRIITIDGSQYNAFPGGLRCTLPTLVITESSCCNGHYWTKLLNEHYVKRD
jgi:hypothetical protein